MTNESFGGEYRTLNLKRICWNGSVNGPNAKLPSCHRYLHVSCQSTVINAENLVVCLPLLPAFPAAILAVFSVPQELLLVALVPRDPLLSCVQPKPCFLKSMSVGLFLSNPSTSCSYMSSSCRLSLSVLFHSFFFFSFL